MSAGANRLQERQQTRGSSNSSSTQRKIGSSNSNCGWAAVPIKPGMATRKLMTFSEQPSPLPTGLSTLRPPLRLSRLLVGEPFDVGEGASGNQRLQDRRHVVLGSNVVFPSRVHTDQSALGVEQLYPWEAE